MRPADAIVSPLRSAGLLVIRSGGSTGRIGSFGKTRRGGRKMHGGLDLLASIGLPVYAIHDGVVTRAGEQHRGKGYGQRLYLDRADGLETRYAHLSVEFVRTDQFVRAGHCLGLSGDSGNATPADGEANIPPHVHLEMRLGEQLIDPEAYLREHGIEFYEVAA